MSHSDFVHLHVHSHYSMLQATGKIGDLVKAAKRHGMPALALTDHGNLFGAVEFYKEAKKAGIVPILGCEMFVSEGSRFDQKKDWHRLVLLCRDERGYQNLMKLVSRSYTEGFYKKPRIDMELLGELRQGLIATSSLLEGPIAKRLSAGRADEARDWAARYRDLFGKDPSGEPNFYVEVQDHGLPEERMVGHRLVQVSQELGIPLVLTNDVHYLEADDALAHQVLMYIGQGRQLEVPEGREVDLAMGSDQFHFRSPEEMQAVGKRFPGAYENALKIARRCHLKLEFGVSKLPRFEVPAGSDPDAYLLQLCREAIPARYPDASPERLAEISTRLDFEHGIIRKMGYSAYFLIVWDFIRKAREMGIPVGPGRGSAAGSLIAYLTGITNLCPLTYGLYFERFLNPERVSMPDVDVDFDFERRQEVIDYVIARYGKDCVSQIITFGTLSAKAALKDVARVLGLPFHEANAITKAVPEELFITLKKALAESKDLAQWAEKYPRLFKISLALEGCCRNAGTHAAGVVIAPAPLETLSPMYCRDGDLATQYNMKAIEEVGLLKMDFLGLKTLTVIRHALDLIQSSRGMELDLDQIPLDDLRTYSLLAAGDTLGVFQFESSGFRDLLRRVRPGVFEDLIALLALYRPGPLGSGMVDDFIETKHGRKPASYPHEKLATLLEETYGVMLYQEQVMACASILAGYSLGQSDQLRRAMGKKKPEEMERHKEIFVTEAGKRGVDTEKAGEIFGLMEKFAGYGFNKSHSAAYALVSYQTAFLKANFPTEFLAAVLTNEAGDTDQLAHVFEECRRMGIVVRGPDVNRSARQFSVHEGEILFGLEAIKGMGAAVVEAILEARRDHGSFHGLDDFTARVDLRIVNRRSIEALVKSGAFDSCGRPRSQLLASVEAALEHGSGLQAHKTSGQATLLDFCASQGGEFGTGGIEFPEIAEFQERDLLRLEKEALGFYLSGHPLYEHRKWLAKLVTHDVPAISSLPVDTTFRTAGLVKGLRKRTIKASGRDMAIATLEDLVGSSEFAVFPDLYDLCREDLIEDEILLVSGRLSQRRGDEEKKIDLESVVPLGKLADSRNWGLEVTLRTSEEKLAKVGMGRLKNALLGHPGTRGVLLELEVGSAVATIRLGDSYRLAPGTEMVEDLEGLLGEGAVRIQVQPPPPPERRSKGSASPAPPPPPRRQIKAVAADRAGPPSPAELEELDAAS